MTIPKPLSVAEYFDRSNWERSGRTKDDLPVLINPANGCECVFDRVSMNLYTLSDYYRVLDERAVQRRQLYVVGGIALAVMLAWAVAAGVVIDVLFYGVAAFAIFMAGWGIGAMQTEKRLLRQSWK